MSNRALGIVIFLVALAIWIGVYWFFLSHSYQNRLVSLETGQDPNEATLEGPMTSEAEMRFLKEPSLSACSCSVLALRVSDANLRPSSTNPFEQDGYSDEYTSRGDGAYAGDDKAFRRPSQSRTDDGQPQDILNEVLDHGGPAGPMLTGGGPVRPIGGDVDPKKRYKMGRGGQSNGGL